MLEIDRLRKMLDDANIPYDSYIENYPKEFAEILRDRNDSEFMRNQIVYGQDENDPNKWRFDAIFQFGSHGYSAGLLETWGELGSNADGDPDIKTAEECFEIISKDFFGTWEAQ